MFLQGYLPSILDGMVLTLEISLASLFVSVLLGLMGTLLYMAPQRPLIWLAELYSTVVRGIPDLVWLFVLFFGGQMLANDIASYYGTEAFQINSFIAGTLTLSFIFGAYMTETFRGAMLAVPRGQIEAGIAFGMRPMQIFFRITLPQMLRFALPGCSNNWLVLLKTTALVSVIGLPDMMYQTNTAQSATQQPFTAYLTVAVLYLVITSLSTLILTQVRKRYSLGVIKETYNRHD